DFRVSSQCCSRLVKIRPQSAGSRPRCGPRAVAKPGNALLVGNFQEGDTMFADIARAFRPACFAAVLAITPSFASEEPAGHVVRPKPIVAVAFVLDTTGSMGPLIEGAK